MNHESDEKRKDEGVCSHCGIHAKQTQAVIEALQQDNQRLREQLTQILAYEKVELGESEERRDDDRREAHSKRVFRAKPSKEQRSQRAVDVFTSHQQYGIELSPAEVKRVVNAAKHHSTRVNVFISNQEAQLSGGEARLYGCRIHVTSKESKYANARVKFNLEPDKGIVVVTALADTSLLHTFAFEKFSANELILKKIRAEMAAHNSAPHLPVLAVAVPEPSPHPHAVHAHQHQHAHSHSHAHPHALQ
jgi:hypothetical protein